MITLLQETLNILPYEIVCDIMYKYKGLRHPIATALKNEEWFEYEDFPPLNFTIRGRMEFKKIKEEERKDCILWHRHNFYTERVELDYTDIHYDIGFFDDLHFQDDWAELENRFPKVLIYHFFSNFYYLRNWCGNKFEAKEIKKYWGQEKNKKK
tara:strand:+ start:231 stop:692 length:462 start_codon:yes stop_codon:yes gene_type:complete